MAASGARHPVAGRRLPGARLLAREVRRAVRPERPRRDGQGPGLDGEGGRAGQGAPDLRAHGLLEG
eukprot:6283675-Lingulodinium_polyedra.AAC.1